MQRFIYSNDVLSVCSLAHKLPTIILSVMLGSRFLKAFLLSALAISTNAMTIAGRPGQMIKPYKRELLQDIVVCSERYGSTTGPLLTSARHGTIARSLSTAKEFSSTAANFIPFACLYQVYGSISFRRSRLSATTEYRSTPTGLC